MWGKMCLHPQNEPLKPTIKSLQTERPGGARALGCMWATACPRLSTLNLHRCRLSDLVGADIGLHVGHNVAGSYSERVYPSRIIQALVDAKRLGEKTGAGFYKFDAERKAAPDPELAPFVERSRKVRKCVDASLGVCCKGTTP